MSALLAIAVLTAGGLAVLWLPSPLPAHAGSDLRSAGAMPVEAPGTALRGLGRRLRRRRAAAEAAEWVEWIRQLAALIRAGQSAAAAFAVSAQTSAQAVAPSPSIARQEQICRTAAAASGLGRSPSASLLSEAAALGRPRGRLERTEVSVLRDLARCWEISERTGAPLAALLEGVAEAAEGDLDADAARETALAGAKATVRILSWLPVLALGLGLLIGADPLRTLLTTPWGIAAGVAGAVLSATGRVWTRRLVQQAEAPAGHRTAARSRRQRSSS